MVVRRETHLSHMRRPVHTTLEWSASCAHAVNVCIGQDEVMFQFGMDRKILATILGDDPDVAVDQSDSCIAATTLGERLKVTIKIKPPNEDGGRTVELWGKVNDWHEFLLETEKEVPFGSETTFAAEDEESFAKLGITL